MLTLTDFSIEENILKQVRKTKKIKYKFSDDAIFNNNNNLNSENDFFEEYDMKLFGIGSKKEYEKDLFEEEEEDEL